MSLSRDAILAAVDSAVQEVDVPEWGGKVLVRVLSGTERDAMEAEVTGNGGKLRPNFRGRFAALVLADPDGKRIFTDADAVTLGKKAASALSRIMDAALALNRIGAGEVTAALGESEGVQS